MAGQNQAVDFLLSGEFAGYPNLKLAVTELDGFIRDVPDLVLGSCYSNASIIEINQILNLGIALRTTAFSKTAIVFIR